MLMKLSIDNFTKCSLLPRRLPAALLSMIEAVAAESDLQMDVP